MDAALYHPDFGYYARVVQRSGRAGDFFTSVDVGPLFGELLAKQIVEMAEILAAPFDLVEAGAGNGRLTADILRALKRHAPETYDATHAHLVEASEAARATHESTLAESADRLVSSSTMVPESFEGVLIANELLDAMPVHQVVMRENGLREVYVESHAGRLRLCEGPLSTPRLSEYFAAIGANLEPGWRADVSLAAIDWVRDASRRLTRGFIILIDYGHDAAELYSVTHSAGTLTTFAKHRSSGPESASTPWLHDPGQQDLTAHVDFTSVRRAAESEGCTMLGLLDQMYFLLALVPDRLETLDVKERLALKMLVMPGGLGTTMKVMILGKGVDAPKLAGLSSHIRVT
jgi:SAM-dependent MidA family methyltransferase